MIKFISEHPYLISSITIALMLIIYFRVTRHRIPVPDDTDDTETPE